MTLGIPLREGLAQLSRQFLRHTLPRAAMTITAVAAFVAGVAATAAAWQGSADPGVSMEGPGGHVLAVSPTGFAWQAGIRTGQVVVSFTRAEVGWELVASDGTSSYTARAAEAQSALSDSLPIGLGSLVLGTLALLARRTRRDWVVPVASLGLALGAVPLWLLGNPGLSTAAMLGAAAVPAGWLVLRLPVPDAVRAGAMVALAVGLWLWAAARVSGSADYGGLESIREPVVLWSTVAVLALRVARPVFSGTPVNVTRPALFDLAIVGGLAAISVSLVVIDALTPVELAIGLLLVLLVLPAVRRRAGPALQKALLGDIREIARAEGADEERGKLARQLHDEHLQELTAVIRRLEVKAGTEAERDDLRGLAGRLRGVASELRPPVLEDFGLPGALAHLAEQANSEACSVVARTQPSTSLDRRHRPPEDVELAVYRIAGEAVLNAKQHAHAAHIEIRASIAQDAISVDVADDGMGVTPAQLRSAASRNRMGVGSMRRRAAAIDADFSIKGAEGVGTTVHLEWHR